uniref:Uncharacterized protein n=1 Tax=Arundo donax TaxID=35708 RepID=A0A0A8YMY2_ARUDO
MVIFNYTCLEPHHNIDTPSVHKYKVFWT